MPHDRYYIEGSLNLSTDIKIADDEYHHLIRVMRVKEGEQVECFNGQGWLASAKVIKIEKKSADLLIVESHFFDAPKCPLVLAQAYPRQNKLDYILEKGCELGMQKIYLFPGDRSEKSETSDNQKIRMRHLLQSASKQCGQLWVPEIVELPPLSKWNNLDYRAFYGDVRSSAPKFQQAWKSQIPDRGAMFFVGPEKGFSDKEVLKMEELGAVGVKLHNHILRAETAPLAALSLMSHWLMPE